MVEIDRIEKKSIAAKLGITSGDKIVAINGKKIKDYIDFQFETADSYFELKIADSEKINIYEIEKGINENLGIKFDKIIFDKLKTCNNNCIFCFIDQLPENGLRETLYKKDDDYRFSFLQGSFITLTNLTEKDWQRIEKMNLSPLNISVHTTNSDLRSEMLNNKKAGKIKEHLQRLTDSGIQFNVQVVLCPGINDDQELDKTINDLKKYYPSLISLGIVPIGITKFNDNKLLKTYNKNMARKVVKQIIKWQRKLENEFDKNWLYIADEFYFLADREIPAYAHYNNFPQLENGIGQTRRFWSDFKEMKDKLPKNIFLEKEVGIVTGKLGKNVLKPVKKELNKIDNLKIRLLAIENLFFGKTVTVTGLLTGQDISNYLQKNNTPENIVLPGVIFNDNDFLLDGVTISDFKNNFTKKNFYRCNNIKELIEVIKNGQTSSSNSRKT